MKTFEQLYCDRHRCGADQFQGSLFRATLPWHAKTIAPLLGGFWGRYFEAERELISGVGEATTMHRIREEIRDYFANPVHRQWPRRSVRVRVSTTRLQIVARKCGVADPPGDANSAYR